MAVRDDFAAGEVLAAADLNDTFASKLDLAGGKILQIVRATDSADRSTTSTSFVDTNLSVTITPQKSDSAVLLIATAQAKTSWSSGDDGVGYLIITDSSNNGMSGAQSVYVGTFNITGTSVRQTFPPVNLIAYVTPATTSAVTYKLRFRCNSAAVTTELLNSSTTAQMYAIEVSA